ncbi:MAG: glycosyltransferase family 2 protein [Clostridia bacterium]
MEEVKVSVCIPVFNMEKYIEDCIISLVNQTLQEIELIFVDDGSSDNSLNILNKYKQIYPNKIKIISQSNTGLGGARNRAILESKGEYIGFVDADDFVEITMYERLYSLAKRNNSDIAICNYELYPYNLKTKKKKWFKEYKGKIDSDFLDKNTQPWNKIVSKDLLERVNFKFFKKNGDGVFIYLMLCAENIVTTNEKLYHYRIGHASMSTDFKLNNFINSVNCCEEQIKLLAKTKYKQELEEYFNFRMIYNLLQTIFVAAQKENRKYFEEYSKRLKCMNYKKNKYVNKLKKEFGIVKYVGMMYILPQNYNLSRILCKII